jgi:hypothetical protein
VNECNALNDQTDAQIFNRDVPNGNLIDSALDHIIPVNLRETL